MAEEHNHVKPESVVTERPVDTAPDAGYTQIGFRTKLVYGVGVWLTGLCACTIGFWTSGLVASRFTSRCAIADVSIA